MPRARIPTHRETERQIHLTKNASKYNVIFRNSISDWTKRITCHSKHHNYWLVILEQYNINCLQNILVVGFKVNISFLGITVQTSSFLYWHLFYVQVQYHNIQTWNGELILSQRSKISDGLENILLRSRLTLDYTT